jgi:hypothetical protein
MKTIAFGLPRRPGFWLAAFLGLSLLTWSAEAASSPRITSIQLEDGQLLVTVSVPSGLRKVTIESRPRLGPGGWEPRRVARLSGEGEDVLFRLPVAETLEVLRVRAEESEVLPASFYLGDDDFEAQPAGSGGWLDAMPVGPPREDGGQDGGAGREVVESDIWKLRGDTLYFFNQYRGLQIMDVSQPDEPRVTGSLPMPAAGEQMYLLESGELVLLTRDNCWWRTGSPESRVLIVVPGGDTPRVVAELPITGWIQESRLVGSALYVAAQLWRPVPGSAGETWESGVEVSGIDLSVPMVPVARNRLWVAGYGQVVAATDRFLFVTMQDPQEWRTSVLQLIDIGAPDGTLARSGSLRAAGTIKDKFKIHLHGDVLTVISEVFTTTLFTQLETFSVADPAMPVKLGELPLGLSERLHATRFVEDRVYIVTFFVELQMDPLWVVSLADPANPAIQGELEVPGWSTFLYPWGDRLVAAGIETNQTTVSLFDVKDPAEPKLLERVALGSGWSWSEANEDEKAFQVFPDEGLVLVPYQSWEEGAWGSRVQLIDLFEDSLVARGKIEHTMSPRRATLHRDRVLSVSGRELLSVDIEDRDHPRVQAELALAWAVDRLLVHGQYLLEFSRGQSGWGDPAPPAMRIAPADEPDSVLREVQLRHALPILGAAIDQQRLYLVQGVEGGGWFSSDPRDDVDGEGEKSAPNLFLTVYDVAALPELVEVSGAEVSVEPLGWSAEFELLWPKPGVLVLAGGGGVYGWPWLDWPMIGAEPGFGGPTLWRPNAPWGSGGRLIAFHVTDSAEIEFASEIDLGRRGGWNFSAAQSADGLVFVSHQVTEQASPIIVEDKETGEVWSREPPSWMWVQRSYLDVLDYENPADPMIRRPVQIPGSLIGLSHGGALLYTVGARWRPDLNWASDWTEYLDASAYDGVMVRRVDSLELPVIWPRPYVMQAGDFFLGRADVNTRERALLERWRLSDEGRFNPLVKIELQAPAERLLVRNELLLVQAGGEVVMMDIADSNLLRRVGGDTPPGCGWVDLNRAEGDLERGIWVPLGLNGVWRLPIVSGILAMP